VRSVGCYLWKYLGELFKGLRNFYNFADLGGKTNFSKVLGIIWQAGLP
jgi:hypothetical protein